MGKAEKVRKYLQEYGISYTISKIYYRYLIKYHVGKKKFPFRIAKDARAEQEKYRPRRAIKISLVTALYNTPEKFLREMIQSVLDQTYGDWELCLVDASDAGGEQERIVGEYGGDTRIRYKRLSANQGISENTNEGFAMAQGDYVGIVDHDDLLHPSALYHVVRKIEETGADMVYTDELSFEKKVSRVQSVHLKSEYSRETLCSNNYICHFTVFRRKLLQQVGSFRKDMDGAQDYDLFLRLAGVSKTISHVSRVLYYWRIHAASSASGVGAKPYVVEAGKKALEEHFQREKIAADVTATEFGPFYRVRYKVPPHTRVLLIGEKEEISFFLGGGQFCFSFPVDMISYREILQKKIHIDEKYDRIVLMRDGYCSAEGEQNWLEELVACLVPENNLVSAPVVVDEKGRICHGGYCYHPDFPEKIRPLYRKVPAGDPGYMNHLAFRQSLSLLGGAVLCVKGALFQKFCQEQGVETLFSQRAWFSLCLMAQKMGGECILSPYALFQGQQPETEEGRQREEKEFGEEGKAFWQQWDEVLSEPDPHLPEQMKTLGRYYFYWQEER
jgi:glycosyltransferase involved in cell wall biosynthesis